MGSRCFSYSEQCGLHGMKGGIVGPVERGPDKPARQVIPGAGKVLLRPQEQDGYHVAHSTMPS
jgi:hypothetical protein